MLHVHKGARNSIAARITSCSASCWRRLMLSRIRGGGCDPFLTMLHRYGVAFIT
jgi:hypothetical protein